MRLNDLQKNWENFGETNPLWAIHTGEGEIEWDEQAFFDSGRADISRVLGTLADLGIEPPRERALDFGCGVGRLSFPLSKEFNRVDGVDISAPMIEAASAYARADDDPATGSPEFHLNTRLDLALFPDRQFTFILSLVVLQHMKPQFSRTYIAEFCRLLAPGGILLFQIPARRETLALRIRNIIGRTSRKLRYALKRDQSPVMEMYGTSRARVEELIRQNGLEPVASVRDESADTWESYTYVATRPLDPS